jgi:hypothetical protein
MEEVMPDRASFEQVVADVAKHFSSPDSLLRDPVFDSEQKMKLLRRWENDLRRQQGVERRRDEEEAIMAALRDALAQLDAGDAAESNPGRT